jgi:integrase
MEIPAFDPFANKPDISASSRKLYTFNLTKLNNGKPIKDLKFLSNADMVEKINTLKPNTRRTYLISVVSALKNRPEAKFKKLYAKFYELLVNLNKELKDNTEKTEKVKENWMEQDGVKEKQEELKEILNQIHDKKKITETEYKHLLDLVVLSLYTLQQPRRNKDYTEMMVVKKLPEETTKNYLDLGDWNWVFNNYKTQKKYKQQIISVPEDLKSILQVYLKFHPQAKEIKKKNPQDIHFLVHQDGSPISTSTEMTRMLNKIFGKKIGCSMLRAIFLTDKYGKASEELKADTEAMGTSVGTANTNYIKQD